MVSESPEVSVFTDTNLGTHFAISISPNITVPNFKRELENRHLSCFPDIGEIRVNALMVKRKSRLYHLSESFPLKYAFLNIKRAYFFHIEACHQGSSVKVASSSEHVAEKKPETFIGSSKSNTKFKRKKRKLKRFCCFQNVLREVLRAGHLSKRRKKKKKCLKKNFVQNYPVHGLSQGRDWNFSPLDETSSDTLSGSVSVSVSGIINKYFSNSDELTSSSEVNFAGIRTWPQEQVKIRTELNSRGPYMNTPPDYSAKEPPETSFFQLPGHSIPKTSTGVGKRVLIASNSLRSSRGKQKPAISHRSSFVRSLVFEISDEDE